jgi:hypothetical protein
MPICGAELPESLEGLPRDEETKEKKERRRQLQERRFCLPDEDADARR